MYSPDAFRVTEPERLAAFMRAHAFATLITHDGEGCHASHVPVLHRAAEGWPGVLLTHLARGNPQARHLREGREALAIFHGPHAYVSPAWYATQPAVPTWNYAVVHAVGVPREITEPGPLAELMHALVEEYEAGRDPRWPGELPDDFRARMMQGIVGIEIRLTRVEGKFKLSQNRPPADVAGVIAGLSAEGDAGSRALAEFMRAGAA